MRKLFDGVMDGAANEVRSLGGDWNPKVHMQPHPTTTIAITITTIIVIYLVAKTRPKKVLCLVCLANSVANHATATKSHIRAGRAPRVAHRHPSSTPTLANPMLITMTAISTTNPQLRVPRAPIHWATPFTPLGSTGSGSSRPPPTPKHLLQGNNPSNNNLGGNNNNKEQSPSPPPPPSTPSLAHQISALNAQPSIGPSLGEPALDDTGTTTTSAAPGVEIHVGPALPGGSHGVVNFALPTPTAATHVSRRASMEMLESAPTTEEIIAKNAGRRRTSIATKPVSPAALPMPDPDIVALNPCPVPNPPLATSQPPQVAISRAPKQKVVYPSQLAIPKPPQSPHPPSPVPIRPGSTQPFPFRPPPRPVLVPPAAGSVDPFAAAKSMSRPPPPHPPSCPNLRIQRMICQYYLLRLMSPFPRSRQHPPAAAPLPFRPVLIPVQRARWNGHIAKLDLSEIAMPNNTTTQLIAQLSVAWPRWTMHLSNPLNPNSALPPPPEAFKTRGK